jgi:hypothetical protein
MHAHVRLLQTVNGFEKSPGTAFLLGPKSMPSLKVANRFISSRGPMGQFTPSPAGVTTRISLQSTRQREKWGHAHVQLDATGSVTRKIQTTAQAVCLVYRAVTRNSRGLLDCVL